MIYVINHKPTEYGAPSYPGYREIGVGRMYKGRGNNINDYNPYINEVTALYDIWKNYDDKYVGLVHYRRFFFNGDKILRYDDAINILNQGYDIITTTDYTPNTPYDHLKVRLDEDIIDKYIALMPDKVAEWFYKHTGFNICNMFFASREVMNDYCEWLFPWVLPMVEKFVYEDKTGDENKDRAIGFMIECLFGYYCKDLKRYKMDIRIF